VCSRTSAPGWNRDDPELVREVQYCNASNITRRAHCIDSRDKRESGDGETASYNAGAKFIPNPTETDGNSIDNS
jgi:hypothetical protein